MLRVYITKKWTTIRPCLQRQARNLTLDKSIPPLRPRYLPPILVGTTGCAGIFITAAFIHEKETETLWKKIKNHKDAPSWSKLRELITDDNLFNLDVWEARRKLLLEKKDQILEKVNQTLESYQSLPLGVRNGITKTATVILSMSEAERTISMLIALNLCVFGAWRVPRLQPFMNRYFVHNPTSGRYITLLTSSFSQRQFTHLALNMVGFWTIGPWIYDALGKEQFIALYLSLGIGSNTVSHVAQLALSHRRPIIPSLGASGAIYGLISGTAVMYPEAAVFFALIPIFPIKLSYAIPTLLSLDAASILLRWRMFNHLGHLGGAVLGASYMQFGPNYMWPSMLQEVRNIKKHFNGKKGNGGGNGGGDDTSGSLMEIPRKIRIKLFGKKAAVPEEQ